MEVDPRPAAITAAPGATAVTYIPTMHLNQQNTYLLESCKAVIKLAICRLRLHACTRDAQGITDRGPTDHVDGDSAAPQVGQRAQQETATTSTTPDTASRRRHPEPPLLSGHRTRS